MTTNPVIPPEFIDPVDFVHYASNADTRVRRRSIEALEQQVMKMDQVEIPVKHYFCGDMYAREILIPKGTLLTGAIHKFDHIEVMAYGDLTVSTDDGSVKRVTGYNLFESVSGKKRAAYAHEDTLWINFHSSPAQDPEAMRGYLTCNSFDEYELFQERLALAIQTIENEE